MEEEKKPVNPYTEARRKANKKWDKENSRSFGVYLPLGVYNRMEEAINAIKHSRDPGMTRGKFVREAVERAIEDVTDKESTR